MRVLLTGGAGFIGSHLTRRLCDDGWNVDVVDDLSTGDRAVVDRRVIRFMRMDFADPTLLNRIQAGMYEIVFHLAARARVGYSVEHPVESHKANVDSTVKLIDACRVGSVRRFVFSSSSSVYGGAKILPTREDYPRFPRSPYALQKSVIEDYLRLYHELYGFESVCLRYFNVFGPGQLGGSPYSTAIAAWLTAIGRNEPLRSDGDGEQSRDMCYVDNVVDANVAAATFAGQLKGMPFNVASGQTHRNNEILQRLLVRYPGIVVQHAPERLGDVRMTRASVQRLQSVLGLSPKVGFWEGLERTIAWHEAQPTWLRQRDTSAVQ